MLRYFSSPLDHLPLGSPTTTRAEHSVDRTHGRGPPGRNHTGNIATVFNESARVATGKNYKIASNSIGSHEEVTCKRPESAATDNQPNTLSRLQELNIMNMSAGSASAQDFPDIRSIQPPRDPNQRAILTGLLGVAERVMELTAQLMTCTATGDSVPDSEFRTTSEPTRPGLYRDRDGDIWQRTDAGWRLCVQQGVTLENHSIWNWMEGHVNEYAPFISIATN